ncbi:MAG: phage holin family protein [Thermodesulfobacteriota bacterium]|nr:phage holin family protein [Thermodesulfobacteriota bacterium]
MRGFILKWAVSTAALAAAAWVVKGIIIDSGWALLGAALVIGLLNAFLKPIVVLLTLPLNILTLGLFTFVINAIMILLTSEVVKGFTVNSFWAALRGAIIMSVVGFILNLFIRDNFKVTVVTKTKP